MASEEWRKVPGWEADYEVSSHGRVRSLPRESRNRYGRIVVPGRMLRPFNRDRGYLGVCLQRKRRRSSVMVHCLVALAFIGPRPHEHDVCHFNDERSDNRLDNLRYDTRIGNLADARRNGRIAGAKGERNGRAKITDEIVREIRRRVVGGATHRSLARELGVSRDIVRHVANGKTWSHVE